MTIDIDRLRAAAEVQEIADDVRARFTDHPATRPGRAQEFVRDDNQPSFYDPWREKPPSDGLDLRAELDLRTEDEKAEAYYDLDYPPAKELDPDCAAGTCDCKSKPAPTLPSGLRDRLEILEQRCDTIEGCVASDIDARHRDWDSLTRRIAKLEQRQLAIDGDVSGWREMVNGLRMSRTLSSTRSLGSCGR